MKFNRWTILNYRAPYYHLTPAFTLNWRQIAQLTVAGTVCTANLKSGRKCHSSAHFSVSKVRLLRTTIISIDSSHRIIHIILHTSGNNTIMPYCHPDLVVGLKANISTFPYIYHSSSTLFSGIYRLYKSFY